MPGSEEYLLALGHDRPPPYSSQSGRSHRQYVDGQEYSSNHYHSSSFSGSSASQKSKSPSKKKSSLWRGLKQMFHSGKQKKSISARDISNPNGFTSLDYLDDPHREVVEPKLSKNLSLSHESVFQAESRTSQNSRLSAHVPVGPWALGSETESIPHADWNSSRAAGSATALTHMVQSELQAVLNKRKSREYPSDGVIVKSHLSVSDDEDLGLPRSPQISPGDPMRLPSQQRRKKHISNDGKSHTHSSCSDGSLFSMDSSENDDENPTNINFLNVHKPGNYFPGPVSNSSDTNTTILSHNAAKHKLAVKPKRTHAASRNRHRVLQQLSAPSLPIPQEVDEYKSSNVRNGEVKDKKTTNIKVGRSKSSVNIEDVQNSGVHKAARKKHNADSSKDDLTDAGRNKSMSLDCSYRAELPNYHNFRNSEARSSKKHQGAREIKSRSKSVDREGTFLSRLFGSKREAKRLEEETNHKNISKEDAPSKANNYRRYKKGSNAPLPPSHDDSHSTKQNFGMKLESKKLVDSLGLPNKPEQRDNSRNCDIWNNDTHLLNNELTGDVAKSSDVLRGKIQLSHSIPEGEKQRIMDKLNERVVNESIFSMELQPNENEVSNEKSCELNENDDSGPYSQFFDYSSDSENNKSNVNPLFYSKNDKNFQHLTENISDKRHPFQGVAIPKSENDSIDKDGIIAKRKPVKKAFSFRKPEEVQQIHSSLNSDCPSLPMTTSSDVIFKKTDSALFYPHLNGQHKKFKASIENWSFANEGLKRSISSLVQPPAEDLNFIKKSRSSESLSTITSSVDDQEIENSANEHLFQGSKYLVPQFNNPEVVSPKPFSNKKSSYFKEEFVDIDSIDVVVTEKEKFISDDIESLEFDNQDRGESITKNSIESDSLKLSETIDDLGSSDLEVTFEEEDDMSDIVPEFLTVHLKKVLSDDFNKSNDIAGYDFVDPTIVSDKCIDKTSNIVEQRASPLLDKQDNKPVPAPRKFYPLASQPVAFKRNFVSDNPTNILEGNTSEVKRIDSKCEKPQSFAEKNVSCLDPSPSLPESNNKRQSVDKISNQPISHFKNAVDQRSVISTSHDLGTVGNVSPDSKVPLKKSSLNFDDSISRNKESLSKTNGTSNLRHTQVNSHIKVNTETEISPVIKTSPELLRSSNSSNESELLKVFAKRCSVGNFPENESESKTVVNEKISKNLERTDEKSTLIVNNNVQNDSGDSIPIQGSSSYQTNKISLINATPKPFSKGLNKFPIASVKPVAPAKPKNINMSRNYQFKRNKSSILPQGNNIVPSTEQASRKSSKQAQVEKNNEENKKNHSQTASVIEKNCESSNNVDQKKRSGNIRERAKSFIIIKASNHIDDEIVSSNLGSSSLERNTARKHDFNKEFNRTFEQVPLERVNVQERRKSFINYLNQNENSQGETQQQKSNGFASKEARSKPIPAPRSSRSISLCNISVESSRRTDESEDHKKVQSNSSGDESISPTPLEDGVLKPVSKNLGSGSNLGSDLSPAIVGHSSRSKTSHKLEAEVSEKKVVMKLHSENSCSDNSESEDFNSCGSSDDDGSSVKSIVSRLNALSTS